MNARAGPDPLRRLIRIAAHDRARMVPAAISLALLSLAQLYLTWLVKDWVEGPVMTPSMALLRPLLLRAVAASLIGMASLFVSRYALASANQRLLERVRDQATQALLAAPVAVVGKTSSGEWLSRLFNDVNALSGFLSIIVRRLVTETIILTGAIILMFVLSWRLALATLVIVPITGWLFVWMGKRIRRWGSVAQEAAAVLTSTMNEQLRGFTTVKGNQAEAWFQQRVREEAESLRRRAVRSELWSAALIAIVFLIAGAAFMAMLAFGTWSLHGSGAEQAALLAFCLYAGQAVEPARRLSEVHGLLQQSIAAAVRVFEVIDLPPEEDHAGISDRDPAPLQKTGETCGLVVTHPVTSGSVRFEHVWFHYREDEVVLRDVTFALDDGEIVGLVGASGCGKTTLARLLVRFEEPSAGSVRLGGQRLQDLSLHDLRSTVCLVEQEPFVFSGALIDNIRLGRASASRASIEEAIRMTGLETLVASLPRGLDSPLHEAGRDLSGGERQRIALARAIARDPRLLILDEATSSIDSETESVVFAAMLPWLRRRTVITVSHRLSTVSRLPRVLLIEEGRILEDGDPEMLARESSLFRALFADQLDHFGIAAVPA
jgi:subfamily B ATP-binding cassette protein MsbA